MRNHTVLDRKPGGPVRDIVPPFHNVRSGVVSHDLAASCLQHVAVGKVEQVRKREVLAQGFSVGTHEHGGDGEPYIACKVLLLAKNNLIRIELGRQHLDLLVEHCFVGR